MSLCDLKYKYNQTIIKVYGYGDKKKIKVITMKCLRTVGVEDDIKQLSLRGSVNDQKLDESIIRAKNKVFDLAFCNPWQYFFTGTLNPNLYDRSNLDKFHKDLTQWLRNQNKKLNTKIDFLLIPELHDDGTSWHIHGLIKGLPDSELKQFVIGDKMGKGIVEKVIKGDTVLNWLAYQKKFGFCDLEYIRNSEAVSKYITKYITKSLARCVTKLNAHLYYHSRGLNTSQTIKRGTLIIPIEPDFTNEYCSVKWYDYSEEVLEKLKSSITYEYN